MVFFWVTAFNHPLTAVGFFSTSRCSVADATLFMLLLPPPPPLLLSLLLLLLLLLLQLLLLKTALTAASSNEPVMLTSVPFLCSSL